MNLRRVGTLAEKLIFETQGGHSARHLLSPSCSDEMMTPGHSPFVSTSGQMMFDRGVSALQTLPVGTHQELSLFWVYKSLLSCLYRGFPVTGNQVL